MQPLARLGLGSAFAVARSDGRLLYGSGTVLVIADVASPAAPAVLSQTHLAGVVQDIAVDDSTAYVALGRGGLAIVDISDAESPTEIGSWANWDGMARGVAVSGNYAYVGYEDAGLFILDISDPTSPSEVGSFTYPSDAFAVAVSGSYAYVAANKSGMRVIDVSDPSNPTEAASAGVYGETRDIVIGGSYAYLATRPGMTIIDISSPTDPSTAGSYTAPAPAQAWGITLAGTNAYLASSTVGLRIIDVATPGSPTEVGAFDSPGEARDVVVSSSYAFVADLAHGVRIVDVSAPASPSEVGSLPSWGHAEAVAVQGSYAYVADRDRGLRIIDVSDPLHPVDTGSCDTPGTAEGVAVSDSHAYVADWDMGLRIIDVSDPANPSEVASVATSSSTGDVVVAGTHAYLADGYTGLRIIDVSNPASPGEPVAYDTSGFAYAVAVSNTYAYVADGAQGLRIIDVTNPSTPTEVGSHACGGWAQNVAVFGNYAFIAANWGTALVIDVSNPASPTQAGNITFGGVSSTFAFSDSHVHIADGTSNLQALDVSSPPEFGWAASTFTVGEARGVALSGSYLFVADGSAGLAVLTACGTFACPTISATWIDGSYCPTIKVYVSVTDSSGQPVSDLTADAFCLNEEGVPKAFTVTAQGDGQYEITYTTARPSGELYSISVCATHDGCTASTTGSVWCQDTCHGAVITAQPESVTILSGETATLSVGASGTEPITYEWYQVPIWNHGDPIAVSTATYTTPPLTDTTSYLVYVSNDCGSAFSETATVTVMKPTSYDYLVPSVAHWPGKNNTAWRTNLAVTNRSTGSASLTLTYTSYETGATTVVQTYTLAAGASVEWEDVLVSLFGYSDSDKAKGSIHISSDVAVLITSRTFNQTLEGTFGQYYPAIDAATVYGGSQTAQATAGPAMQSTVPATEGFTTSETGTLLQLKKSSDFRSNLGVQNLGISSVSVSATLYNASGSQIGSTVTHSIAGNAYWQWDDVFAKAGASSEPLAYAEVQVQTAGGNVWAYGSVVDNVTGDPTTIPTLTGPPAGPYLAPSVAHWPGKNNTAWRTNLAAANRNASSASLTLTYTSYETGATTEVRSATLAAGESMEWQDVLVSLFGYSESDKAKGSIHIASTLPVFITSRTYNQTLEGTFGQYYPAEPSSGGFTTGQVGTVMQLKKSSDFRSNLGVQNLGTFSVDVTVKLYDASGSQVGSTLTHSIAGNAYWQWDDVFAKAGAAAEALACATVEVQTSGGRVWAYGSVVDNVTGDPTTVPVLLQ